MFSSLALDGMLAQEGGFGGHMFAGGIVFFILMPLFLIGVFFLIMGLVRRRWSRTGWGPGMHGHGYHHGYPQGIAASPAESTLAERFAQGDIDEQEYRARLEVLRANNSFAPPATK